MARGSVSKSHVILPAFGMMVPRDPVEPVGKTFEGLRRLSPRLSPEMFDVDADVPR
ncbi:MAG: hypothetical protein L3K09_01675 [Thermoplasmata archaeon]|nr:hypothetical protein [Thermoplasmata archaeon]